MTPIPDLRRRVRPLAWLPPAAIAILLLAGLAAAGGSGYSQSYTRGAGSVSDSSVDLISVSTSDPGGANISVQFQVSGHLNMASQTTGYYVWFGGSSQSNSSAWIFFVDNATFGTIYTSSSFT
ncbi:MAG TPA: hypothetical protein VGV64_04915, partial [Thermoplasmata archaeon]|nr:hypothetical protein [Thermoplasmata archaeon]